MLIFFSIVFVYMACSINYIRIYDRDTMRLRANVRVGDEILYLKFHGRTGLLHKTTVLNVTEWVVYTKTNEWVHRNSIYPPRENTLEGYIFNLFF